MQKIQFYLVPNRITVSTDLVGNGYTTEFRKVYTRKIKLFKGIDNTIEIEIRNAEQKRQSVVGKEVMARFFDAENKVLFTATAVAIPSKLGILKLTLSKELIEHVDPQQLSMRLSLLEDDEEMILYSDSQFDISAFVELEDGYNDKQDDVLEELQVFNWEFDRKAYVSEIGNFGRRINDDYAVIPNRTITAEMVGIYQGIIEAEVTRDKSVAIGVNWTKITPVASDSAWDSRDTPAATYQGDWRFIRFLIVQPRSNGVAGSGARFTVTKVDGVYTNLTATLRGQNYLIGDQLTILGSQLGGADGVHDIIVTVTGLINGVSSQGNIDTFTWSGLATQESGSYESVGTDPVTRPPNPIDKIIIRN